MDPAHVLRFIYCSLKTLPQRLEEKLWLATGSKTIQTLVPKCGKVLSKDQSEMVSPGVKDIHGKPEVAAHVGDIGLEKWLLAEVKGTCIPSANHGREGKEDRRGRQGSRTPL